MNAQPNLNLFLLPFKTARSLLKGRFSSRLLNFGFKSGLWFSKSNDFSKTFVASSWKISVRISATSALGIKVSTRLLRNNVSCRFMWHWSLHGKIYIGGILVPKQAPYSGGGTSLFDDTALCASFGWLLAWRFWKWAVIFKEMSGIDQA